MQRHPVFVKRIRQWFLGRDEQNERQSFAHGDNLRWQVFIAN